jgi:hypothetical protein
MKTFFLRHDVYACQTGDGSILMDLKSGQYFGLDLQSTLAIAPRIEGWLKDVATENNKGGPTEADELLVNTLVSYPALLTESRALGKAADFPVLHQTDSIPFRGNIVPAPRIGGRHVAAFGCAFLQALLDVKCRSLASTVRRIRARKQRGAFNAPNQARVVELVRTFRFLRLLSYTTKDNCLFDSLALVEYLARFDVHPTWVIAVRTRPFAAHSWVLHDTLVLNERLETVEEFFPILAV